MGQTGSQSAPIGAGTIMSESEKRDLESAEEQVKQLKEEQKYMKARSEEIANEFKKEMYVDTPFYDFCSSTQNEILNPRKGEKDDYNPTKVLNRILADSTNRSLMDNIDDKIATKEKANIEKRKKLEALRKKNEELKQTLQKYEQEVLKIVE